MHKKLFINGLSLPSCPTWNNPLLTAGGKILAENSWQNHNVSQVGQIVRGGNIIPFDEIKAQFGLNDSAFLQYLQLRSIFKKTNSKGNRTGICKYP